MSQTLLQNLAAPILNSAGTIAPGLLTRTFQAADTGNGNAFLSSGHDLLAVYNSDSSAHNLFIASAPDTFGRSVTVEYSVAAGSYSVIEVDSSSIFVQPNTNMVLVSSDSALVAFMVIMNG